MSLILEALRKSETERRRGEAPDLLRADPLPAMAAASPWRRWPPAVAVLLLAALLVWWPRGTPPRVAATHSATIDEPAIAATAARPATEPASMPAIQRLQAAPAAPVAPASPSPEPAPDSSDAPVAAAPGTPASPASPTRLGALPPAERKSLPPLRLSMHLWNEDPARRVAILDGRRVIPGDRVGDAVVADIRPDGVLLEWAGRQVLVPLP